MVKLIGRAASAIRPGIIIKDVLMGKLPLSTGEFVTEAAIVDLFNAYKRQLMEHNQVRSQKKQIRGMHYRSFYTLFRFAQLLHLVEFVREEEADWRRKAPITLKTSLVRVEEGAGTGKLHRVISNKRVFRLSAIGKEDVKSWLDLCRAWREGWTAPQIAEIPVIEEEVATPSLFEVEAPPLEVVPPEYAPVGPPPKRPRGRPRTKPMVEGAVEVEKAPVLGVPRLKLQIRPSGDQFYTLYNHLLRLRDIGSTNEDVKIEIRRLAVQVGEWVAEAAEAVQRAHERGVAREVIEVRYLRDKLIHLDEALLDDKLGSAIEQLTALMKAHPATVKSEVVEEKIAPEPVQSQPTSPKPAPKKSTKVDLNAMDVDTLRNYLTDLMDDEHRGPSIKKLQSALSQLDYDKFEGLEDIDSAIEAYQDAEKDDKESAFEDVMATIEEISVIEMSEEEGEEEE